MENCIKKFRKLYKWTQEELADRLGVCRQTVIMAEQSKNDPGLELAFRMARIFNCTIEELFYYK